MLKFYPDTRKRWAQMVFRDILALAWVGAWVGAGLWVRLEVLRTEVVADRLKSAGEAINNALGGLSGVFSSLASLPLFGSIFKAPSAQTPGDALIAMSASVRSDIEWIALGALGLVVLPPVLYVLLTYVPWRWRAMKEMGSALIFVKGAHARGQTEQAKALLAYRALARLSFGELMAASNDPIGDIMARRYDLLAGAMLEEAGLEWKRLEGKDHKSLVAVQPRRLAERDADEENEG
jgi:hypothetical protein